MNKKGKHAQQSQGPVEITTYLRSVPFQSQMERKAHRLEKYVKKL
jgi:hypothetical protein